MIPSVVAIERGIAQTVVVLATTGLKDQCYYNTYEAEAVWKVTQYKVKVLYAYLYVI